MMRRPWPPGAGRVTDELMAARDASPASSLLSDYVGRRHDASPINAFGAQQARRSAATIRSRRIRPRMHVGHSCRPSRRRRRAAPAGRYDLGRNMLWHRGSSATSPPTGRATVDACRPPRPHARRYASHRPSPRIGIVAGRLILTARIASRAFRRAEVIHRPASRVTT